MRPLRFLAGFTRLALLLAEPSCVGAPGRWVDDNSTEYMEKLTWRYDASCKLPIASIEEARAKLPNHTVYFIG